MVRDPRRSRKWLGSPSGLPDSPSVPFEGSRRLPAIRRRVTATPTASHQVEMLYRVLWVPPYQAHWVGPIPPRPCCFQTGPRGLPSDTVPRVLSIAGSSSRGLAPCSENFTSCHLRSAFASRAFLGVTSSLHRDINASSPLSGSRPNSCLRSAHAVSHDLDGLLLAAPCGLVSSHSHVRDSLLRGFPQQPVLWAFTHRYPHAVSAFRLPEASFRGQLQALVSRASIPTAGPL